MTKGIVVALCLAIVVSAANCRFLRSASNDIIYFELDNGAVITEDLSAPIAVAQSFNADDVSLYLYTQTTGPDNPCKVTSDSCASWTNCGFDPNKVTVVVSHGYAGSYTGANPQVIKNAYLARKDLNIVLIDWSKLSFPYLVAVASVKDVGQTVARVITFLQTNCGADPQKVECVGHSLGAHVCGLFCASLSQKCARIVGLDPAEPIIGLFPPEDRLEKTDALNLQNIHTSSIAGDTSAFGDIDFYPNGARDQYNCTLLNNIGGACDHNKACPLFADTILHPKAFTTDLTCASADAALLKACPAGSLTVTMGEENNRSNRGVFYINTYRVYAQLQSQPTDQR